MLKERTRVCQLKSYLCTRLEYGRHGKTLTLVSDTLKKFYGQRLLLTSKVFYCKQGELYFMPPKLPKDESGGFPPSRSKWVTTEYLNPKLLKTHTQEINSYPSRTEKISESQINLLLSRRPEKTPNEMMSGPTREKIGVKL